MFFTSKNKLVVLLILTTFLTGCGYYKETNTQIRDTAYLHFVGNISKDYTVMINDKYKFKLNSCTIDDTTGHCINNISETLYEVTSGNITIKVTDNDKKLVLEKSMYVGSGNTAEVNL
jgi:hypothetical protein